jgi:hypothetical protein
VRAGTEVLRLRPVSIVNPNHPVNVARRRAEAEGPGSIFADQFENLANMRAHLVTGVPRGGGSRQAVSSNIAPRAAWQPHLHLCRRQAQCSHAQRPTSQPAPPQGPAPTHACWPLSRAPGREIWEQTGGRVDAFVSGAGTGGTIAGVSAFLKSVDTSVLVFLVDPPGSSLYNKVRLEEGRLAAVDIAAAPAEHQHGACCSARALDLQATCPLLPPLPCY